MTTNDPSNQSSLIDGNNQQINESSDSSQQQQQQQPPPDYHSSTIQENDLSDNDDEGDNDNDDGDDDDMIDENNIYDENGQVKFPSNDLIKLEEQLNQTRWVVPVLPDGELKKCLRAAVRLATRSRNFRMK